MKRKYTAPEFELYTFDFEEITEGAAAPTANMVASKDTSHNQLELHDDYAGVKYAGAEYTGEEFIGGDDY